MILISCVDDALGMAFLGRRVSRDSTVTERILALTAGKRLLATPYSARLLGDGVLYAEDPAGTAKKGDFVLLENIPVPTRDVERILLFRWNRAYPSDLKFPLESFPLRLLSKEEFSGTSHEKITLEEYEVLS
ncbi:MAG: ribonuclease Z [Clostridia bacterium]|nr:ribonuclease Z [Clostridia bacterium]